MSNSNANKIVTVTLRITKWYSNDINNGINKDHTISCENSNCNGNNIDSDNNNNDTNDIIIITIIITIQY